MEGSRGMFRWAVCQMDTLGRRRNRLALREALKALPRTLDETYERILCEISDEDSEYAMRILQWLVFSFRPLSVEELAEVIAIDVERDPAIDRDEILEDPMEVLDICLSLVSVVMTEEVSPDDNSPRTSRIVILAHYSVQEYLISTRICQGRAKKYSMQPVACHGYIAKASICYLLQYESGFFDRFDDEIALQEVYALAQYSARSWIFHTRNAEEPDDQLSYLATKFLSTGDGAYVNWLRLDDPTSHTRRGYFQGRLNSYPNPLYYVSQGGLTSIVSRLIDEGADLNAQGRSELGYSTALAVASAGGYDTTVELLLSKGADSNAQEEGYFGNALAAASANGYNRIIELLLSKGADINAQRGRYYSTALVAASGTGYDKTVELLLSKGADPNTQGEGYCGTALQVASAEGYENIVELLLHKGADVNAPGQGNDCYTALQAASAGGHDRIVELLLSRGAQLNILGGKDYSTALQVASDRGHDKVVEVLLSNGADVNVPKDGRYGGTALQMALAGGHDKVVELLLSKGADVNAPGRGYDSSTALQVALASAHNKVVELLLSKGAEVKI